MYIIVSTPDSHEIRETRNGVNNNRTVRTLDSVHTRIHTHTRRPRFIRMVAIVLLLSLSFSFGLMFKAYAVGKDQPAQTAALQQIDVGPGDTLWSIAQEHAGSRNVRAYLNEMKELNGLKNSSLTVGQLLYLPSE